MRAPRPLRPATAVALGFLAVALLGVAVRLLPLAGWAVWGSDTGEYHRITTELVTEGRLAPDAYPGWGSAYPWFPGMYAVAGAIAVMTGVSPDLAVRVAVPALAGLSALGAALLTHRLTREALAAVLAGAVVAVAMPHAFATSHAMPGAVGHLLGLAALLLVWRAEEGRAWWPALLLVLAALVATHHLSTYMLLLALGGMAGVRALLVARPEPARHATLMVALGALLAMAVAWWAAVPPLRERIVPDASSLGLPGLAVLAVLAFAALALLPRLRAEWGWRFHPGFAGRAAGLRKVGLMFAVVFVGIAVVGFVRIPGTTVQITPYALAWFLPLVAVLAFGFLGSQLAKFRPRGALVYGWALAVLASFAAMGVVGSTVLLPYRHTEYIVEAAAVLSGIGLAAAVRHVATQAPNAPAAVRRKAGALGGVAALLLLNVVAAYPPPVVLAGFQEGTTAGEMRAVAWARDHVGPVMASDGLIAADHRMSSMLFGYGGLDATWEYAPRTFHAASFEAAEDEMRAVDAPSGVKRVDYVFLSDAMRDSLALLQWEPARPLDDAAQAKFDRDPRYLAVCRSDEVVVYRVLWDGPAVPDPSASAASAPAPSAPAPSAPAPPPCA